MRIPFQINLNNAETEEDEFQKITENHLSQDPINSTTIQMDSGISAHSDPIMIDSQITNSQVNDPQILEPQILDPQIPDSHLQEPQMVEPQIEEEKVEEISSIGAITSDHLESDQSVPITQGSLNSNPLTIGSSEVGETLQIQKEEKHPLNPLPGNDVAEQSNIWSYFVLFFSILQYSQEKSPLLRTQK